MRCAHHIRDSCKVILSEILKLTIFNSAKYVVSNIHSMVGHAHVLRMHTHVYADRTGSSHKKNKH
jgi:hypothetical protein